MHSLYRIFDMQKITTVTVLTLGLLFLGGLFYVNHPGKPATPAIHGVYLPEGRTLVPFSLQSTLGKPFSDQNFKNKWTLMFFGYTHCPDICPTTLSVLNQTWLKLAKNSLTKALQVVFVSIDPDRDELASLGQYVHYFNADFIGATGPEQELKELTHELGVLETINVILIWLTMAV